MSVALAQVAPLADEGVTPVASPAEDSRRQFIQQLIRHAKAYQGADHRISLWQLASTFALYVAASVGVVASFKAGLYWAQAPLTLLAAGLLIRLFIFQHDCGHGSFFNKRQYNNAVGRFLSVFTFTPYDFWRRSHNLHHAHSGNLDLRGLGGVDTITVAEYRALSPLRRLGYRLMRNPLLLLAVLAPLNIMLFQRFPVPHSMPWLDNYDSISHRDSLPSIMGLNVALLAVYGALGAVIGWQALFMAYLPVVYVTAIIGGWMFYIQHQFEHTYWQPNAEWNFHEAALYSSSHYILPPVLQWFSGSIGLHHLHHFNARIPNYRLQACVDGSPELTAMNRMTLRESFKCLRWALWDEQQQKLIGFRDLKDAPAPAA